VFEEIQKSAERCSAAMIDFTRSFDDGCRDLLRIWDLRYAP